MDTLPDEMLQEIMEYLSYSDLKCFRLVCKKFYEASLAFRIVNRDNFAYRSHMILTSHSNNFDNFIKILFTTERNFYHFHFVNTDITVGFRDFVEKRAKFILSLTFEECEIMYHPVSFCESINECIKLKSLELHDVSWPVCDHAATISLPALETMHISSIPDDMLNVLMDTNVKNLHLCVDIPHLNHVIGTRGRLKDLKSVELWDFCTDEQLMHMADNLNLTYIDIYSCSVTDRGFKYFVEKQSSLQIVAIRDPEFITDESFVAIAENLKDLKELSIYAVAIPIKCSFDALNRIINFTPVRRLSVYGSDDYSGLATAVGDVTVSKCLRQLRMSNVQNETFVTYIAENFLSLTELELTRSNGVTNETLRLICQNMKNLKKLILWDCNAIYAFENDVSQLPFSANFNNLEQLNLCYCEWISDSTLDTCFKLSSLRILKLAYCKDITYKSFVATPKNFPCLENLNMDGVEVNKDMLLSTVCALKRLCELTIWVFGPITERLPNLLYENSDSLHRVNLPQGTFIRSRERKTFIEETECYLDVDLITVEEYEYDKFYDSDAKDVAQFELVYYV